MADNLDPARRSALMRSVRRRDTAPELGVRRALRGMGIGYRLARPDLPGKPDVVLATRRVAVFVHGCFWHGHPGCRRAMPSKSNVPFWSAKIERNRARDARVADELRSSGWHVLVVWECATRDEVKLGGALAHYFEAHRPGDPRPVRGGLVDLGTVVARTEHGGAGTDP